MNKMNVSIDLTLYLNSSLFSGTHLQSFQDSLLRFAPEWASELHLWRFREPRLTIDASREGAIQSVVLSKGLERGKLFERIQELAPSALPGRRFGSIELRGGNQELTVVLEFDDWVFRPLGPSWIPGNSIEIQVRSSLVEGRRARSWVEECFSHCCATLDPFFGFARASDEY